MLVKEKVSEKICVQHVCKTALPTHSSNAAKSKLIKYGKAYPCRGHHTLIADHPVMINKCFTKIVDGLYGLWSKNHSAYPG